MTKHFKQHEKDEMITLYTKTALSLHDIANKFNITGPTLTRYLQKWGIPRRNLISYELSPMDYDAILVKYINGTTTRELAHHYGVAIHVIRRFLQMNGQDTSANYKFTSKEIDDIIQLYTIKDMGVNKIARQYGMSHVPIKRILEEAGINTSIYNRVNHHVFDNLHPASEYWLGYIAGDGCVCGRHVQLTSNDWEHLIKFKDFVTTKNRICASGDKCYVIGFNSEHMANTLISYGITPRKSLTLQILNTNLLNSKHFLRGVIDSDGYIAKDRPTVKIFSSSLSFIDQLKSTLIEHTPAIQSSHRSLHKSYTLSIHRKEEVAKLLRKLYDCPEDIRLNRKFERASMWVDLSPK